MAKSARWTLKPGGSGANAWMPWAALRANDPHLQDREALTNSSGVRIRLAPGGSFGWHSHTGPSLVIVMSGVATEYEGNDPTCTPRLHPAGTTFVDAGESTGHLVRNDGSVNLVVTVVRFVPEGAVQRLDRPNPGFCPSVN